MTILRLYKEDPEIRHLNRYPKGRQEIYNDDSSCRSSLRNSWRRTSGSEEGK
jgi:hypothetical protein